jgi:hypothetical protein
MNIVNKAIQQLGFGIDASINSVMLGYKYIGGIKTNNLSIVFNVDNKKPISELDPSEVIPQQITIDNELYITDVIEDNSPIKALTCYTDFVNEPEILKLQGNPTLSIPIKGGQEIVQFPTKWTPSGGSYSIAVGTLGFMAVDNEDNRPVGVTNAHVACFSYLFNSLRIENSDAISNPYNLYEPINWIVDNNSYPAGLTARNGTNILAPADRLATRIKKYYPIYNTNINLLNYVDVALVHLNGSYLNSSSYMIHLPQGVPDVGFMTFATTEEIDGLLSASPKPPIYSTGRTTGPKGWGSTSSCKLEIDGLFVRVNIMFQDRDRVMAAQYDDIIRFRYEDYSNFPIAPGDSGSAVFANIGGQYKIIGLAFAGNSGSLTNPSTSTHYGYACRIDRIAQLMNIRPWDISYNPNFSELNTTNFEVYSRPFIDGGVNDISATVNNNTYFNVGLANTSNFVLSNQYNTNTDITNIRTLSIDISDSI